MMADSGTSSTFDINTFWGDFLDLMEPTGRTSDVTYYTEGRATEEDYRNAIKVIFDRTPPGSAQRKAVVQLLADAGFWAPTDDLNYWINADASDLGNIADLQGAGAERLPNLFGGEGNTPGRDLSGGGGSQNPDTGTELKILQSPSMKLYQDPQSGKYYMRYKLPNSERFVLFDIDEDQMTALYGSWFPQAEKKSVASLINDGKTTFAGNIAEMEGEGSFESEVAKVTAIGLSEGKLPSWAEGSPEIMDLIYIAQMEQKSTEWLVDKIAQTGSFKARFPGIDVLKSQGLSWADAVTGFLEMENGIKAAVRATGGSDSAVTPDAVGRLLGQGYSLTAAQKGIEIMDRANKYAPAMTAFNEILVSQGKDPITDLQGLFDFMAGEAPSEVYDIWEASSVSEAASAAGLGDVFSAEDAMAYARYTQGNVSLADATGAFQSAAQLLLRLRADVEVERFGLTTDELIDLSLGQPLASGRSPADVQEAINRAVSSAQKSMQQRANPFQSYSREGSPQQQSLSSLRQR